MQPLLTLLNSTYNDPNGTDPFTSVLPGQGGALQGDSSVTPLHPRPEQPVQHPGLQQLQLRYRAGAPVGKPGLSRRRPQRPRLLPSVGHADRGHRLPELHHLPEHPGQRRWPASPQVGAGHTTIPFFASGNLGANTDYGTGGANIRTVTIPAGRDQHLGLLRVLPERLRLRERHRRPAGAGLADRHPPLPGRPDRLRRRTGRSTVPAPQSSDKLAQRNLQVTLSDNPGPADTHRIPQTFDVRPSDPAADQPPGRAHDRLGRRARRKRRVDLLAAGPRDGGGRSSPTPCMPRTRSRPRKPTPSACKINGASATSPSREAQETTSLACSPSTCRRR